MTRALDTAASSRVPLLDTSCDYYCLRCHAPCSQHDLLVGAHVNHDHLSLADAVIHGPSSLLRGTKKTLEEIENHYYRPRRAQEEHWRCTSQALCATRERKVALVAQLQEEIHLIDKDIEENNAKAALAGCHWHHHRQELEQALRRLKAGSRALSALLSLDTSPVRGTEADDMTVVDRYLQERTSSREASGQSVRRCAALPTSSTVARGSAQRELSAVRELVTVALQRLLADNPLDGVVEPHRGSDTHRADVEASRAAESVFVTKTDALLAQRVHPSDGVLALLRAAVGSLEAESAQARRTRLDGSQPPPSESSSEPARPGGSEERDGVDGAGAVAQSSASATSPVARATNSPPHRPQRAQADAWQRAFDDFVTSLKSTVSTTSPRRVHAAERPSHEAAAQAAPSWPVPSSGGSSSEREGSSEVCSSITQYQRDTFMSLRERADAM